jgi:hypothetical protein
MSSEWINIEPNIIEDNKKPNIVEATNVSKKIALLPTFVSGFNISRFVIVISIIILFVVIALSIYYYIKKSKDKQKNNNLPYKKTEQNVKDETNKIKHVDKSDLDVLEEMRKQKISPDIFDNMHANVRGVHFKTPLMTPLVTPEKIDDRNKSKMELIDSDETEEKTEEKNEEKKDENIGVIVENDELDFDNLMQIK